MVIVALVLTMIVAAVWASGGDRRSGPPYGPTSTDPDGAAALVALLRRFDTEVNIRSGMPAESDAVAVVLQAPAVEADLEDLLRFARDGNVVVVADPSTLLKAGLISEWSERLVTGAPDLDEVVARRDCTMDLPDVERLVGLSASFLVQDAAAGCFGSAREAGLVQWAVGDGTVVGVGGPDPFSNAFLARADNAVLATSLLAGRGPVAFVEPVPVTDGEYGLGTLVGLLPEWFWRLMAALVVAAGLSVWASARRLGRPLSEPALLELPATGLTTGVANLYERARRPALAAYWLRARAQRQLAPKVGLPASVSPEELAQALAAADPGGEPAAAAPAIRDLLVSGPVTDGAALLRLSQGLDALAGRHQPHLVDEHPASGAGSLGLPSDAPMAASPDDPPRGPSPSERPRGRGPGPGPGRSAPGNPRGRGPNRRRSDSPSPEVPHGAS
ncbi:MAG: DUF4350 domain-containing protein [Acidimicrobiales bacterium]